jgi:hypothetical protein
MKARVLFFRKFPNMYLAKYQHDLLKDLNVEVSGTSAQEA